VSEQSPPLPLLASEARDLGVGLDPDQLRRFAALAQELLAWNQRVNLTALTDPRDIQIKHFLDSLALVPVIHDELTGRRGHVIDVGSGAGLPGLPLAIALPQFDVTLLEATARKIQFLDHAIRALALENATVLHGRAEERAHEAQHREAYDVATARAAGSTATLIELLIPFLKPGGLAILMKTRRMLDPELDEAAAALSRLQAGVEAVRDGPRAFQDHALVLVRKQGPTPPEYPRRPGIPARRPLVH
jgi:16S rRNA (guanine527-N7)-methyltransferase